MEIYQKSSIALIGLFLTSRKSKKIRLDLMEIIELLNERIHITLCGVPAGIPTSIAAIWQPNSELRDIQLLENCS